ncbi:hypothetical protein DIPPA_32707 [Diplonema papillatum]|nr:hypothetical protein DIPPA_32707 [Diplonema papillatum]
MQSADTAAPPRERKPRFTGVRKLGRIEAKLRAGQAEAGVLAEGPPAPAQTGLQSPMRDPPWREASGARSNASYAATDAYSLASGSYTKLKFVLRPLKGGGRILKKKKFRVAEQ